MSRPAKPDVEELIIAAALDIILRDGVNGLRVRDVARASGCTVAMIYRRFVDREGVLDASVAHFYEKRIRAVVAQARTVAMRPEPITLDDVVDALPLPNYEGSDVVKSLIARVPALAHENQIFRQNIEAIVVEQYPQFEAAIRSIVNRLPREDQFDFRVITTLVLHQNWTLNDLRGPYRVSNDEYREFMLRLLRSSTPFD